MDVEAVLPGERVVVIDDLVATGGTLRAAMRLLGEFLSVVHGQQQSIIDICCVTNDCWSILKKKKKKEKMVKLLWLLYMPS